MHLCVEVRAEGRKNTKPELPVWSSLWLFPAQETWSVLKHAIYEVVLCSVHPCCTCYVHSIVMQRDKKKKRKILQHRLNFHSAVFWISGIFESLVDLWMLLLVESRDKPIIGTDIQDFSDYHNGPVLCLIKINGLKMCYFTSDAAFFVSSVVTTLWSHSMACPQHYLIDNTSQVIA